MYEEPQRYDQPSFPRNFPCRFGTVKDKKDETNVKSIGDTLDKNWANPFSVPNELVSLSTSSVAPESVQQDLLNAKEQGEHAYKAFCTERLMSNQPSKQFHDRLQKLKLKTFSDVKRSR